MILGASVRAAAFSALRAGLQPTCGDLFADRDLAGVAPVYRVALESYPSALVPFARSVPASPWLYTGGLENHPVVVDRISEHHLLWGNDGSTLQAVRDPLRLAQIVQEAGLPCPQIRLTPEGVPTDGSWLVKPLHSAGGLDVTPWNGRPTSPRPSYYQERIEGPSLSALLIASQDGCTLAGVSGQLLGRPGAPLAYVGSIAPWTVSAEVRSKIEVLGALIASAFRLRGLFGIDLILRDGHPWPVEVNPRYTASVEVLELATGRALLDDHRKACDPQCDRRPQRQEPSPLTVPAFVGKQVLFADRACRFPALRDLDDLGTERDLFTVPEIADVPCPGTSFAAGEPVLTVFATGSSAGSCLAELRAKATRWANLLLSS